jgi:hypothetical protein
VAGLYASSIEHPRAPLPKQRRYMQAFIRPRASDLIGQFWIIHQALLPRPSTVQMSRAWNTRKPPTGVGS